jgi:hypothetical protein
MTISEHLEFSVLTAPVASLDRRALSQAWYSALYGSSSAPPQRPQQVDQPLRPRAIVHAVPQSHETNAKPNVQSEAAVKPQRVESTRGGQTERRAPRSGLARKIERTFLHPRAAARKASFSIDGAAGRVEILLHKSGTRMKIIAICAPKAAREVAAALAQARYALAARGIDLDAEMRGDAAW